jgi:hypothetical protein
MRLFRFCRRKRQLRYDSDLDVVVDFPTDIEASAADHVETLCQLHCIPADVHARSFMSAKLLARISRTSFVLQ